MPANGYAEYLLNDDAVEEEEIVIPPLIEHNDVFYRGNVNRQFIINNFLL